jgi:hypothetical protein
VPLQDGHGLVAADFCLHPDDGAPRLKISRVFLRGLAEPQEIAEEAGHTGEDTLRRVCVSSVGFSRLLARALPGECNLIRLEAGLE